MKTKHFYIVILLGVTIIACNKNNDGLPKAEKPASPNYESISGIYQSPFNEGGSFNASVEIKYLGELQFIFTITTATESGCLGLAEGNATIDSNGVGSWSNEDCESLLFKFAEDVVNVEETECGLHGMRCQFQGEYRK